MRGGLAAFAMRVGSAAALFASQIVLAEALGKQGFGEYAVTLAWLQTLAILARYGLDNASLRYVACYDGKDASRMVGYLRCSQAAGVLLGTLVGGLTWLSVWMLRDRLTGSLYVCLSLAALALPFMAVTQIQEAVLRAVGRVTQGMLSLVLGPVLILVLVMVFSQGLGFELGAPAAMLIHVSTVVATCVVAAACSAKHWGKAAGAGAPTFETKLWLGTATSMMFISVLNYLQGRSGTMVSALLLDTSEAGLYAAAERVAGLVLFGIQSINLVAAPRFAALHAAADLNELRAYARQCAWVSTLCACGFGAVVVIFGRRILGCFGGEFVVGYGALLILLIGIVISSASGSCGYLLNMTGYHRTCLIVSGAALLLNLTLCAWLVPRYGVVGTAISNSVSLSLWNIALAVCVQRCLGISSHVRIRDLLAGTAAVLHRAGMSARSQSRCTTRD